ncbi:MAG: FG-GAP repeat protein [Planctomycetes bacterium]|nr:FG-GAP repeat protein [Planctomycetota bacterium]
METDDRSWGPHSVRRSSAPRRASDRAHWVALVGLSSLACTSPDVERRGTPTVVAEQVAGAKPLVDTLEVRAQALLESSRSPVAPPTVAVVDLNGDGVLEIAVGRPFDGYRQGAVEVLDGASGRALWRVEGAAPADEFGRALVVIDDLDGDRVRDLAVGAPATASLGERAGDVVLLSAACGARLGFVSTGWPREYEFGATLAFDGLAHRLYVGVPGAYSTHGGDAFGGVDVFELPSFSRRLRVRFGPEHCLCRTSGLCLPRGVGRALTPLDDMDGDGTRDVLVAAPEPGPLYARAFALSGADAHILAIVRDPCADGPVPVIPSDER